jgi:hypothetical protein
MAWGPIKGYDRAERVGLNEYSAVRGFYSDTGNTHNVMATLYGQQHPDIYGIYRPWCVKVEVRKHGLSETKDLVLAYYVTPRIPGTGKLLWRPSQGYRDREVDLQGDRIRGIDRETGHEFQVVRGPHHFPKVTGKFILQTAYWAGDTVLQNLLQRRDKINASKMNNFLGAPAYTLRYETATVTPDGPNGLVYVDHLFDYEPEGWNNVMYVQEDAFKIVAEVALKSDGTPMLDVDGNVEVKFVERRVPAQRVVRKKVYYDGKGNMVEVPVYEDKEPEARMGYLTANFSDLDALVVW